MLRERCGSLHLAADTIFLDGTVLRAEVRRQFFRGVHFKGSSTTVTNTSTYTPTEYELQLQKLQSDYANAIAPNSRYLNQTARNLLQNSLGTVQVDYNGLTQQALGAMRASQDALRGITHANTQAADRANSDLLRYRWQYGDAARKANAANKGYQRDYTAAMEKANQENRGYSREYGKAANTELEWLSPQYMQAANTANTSLYGLMNGRLPANYQMAMENSIARALNNTMGKTFNAMAGRGVLNGSVTNEALNDITANAANTVAEQYSNNINTVANLANQQNTNTYNALRAQEGIAGTKLANTNNMLGQQAALTAANLANRNYAIGQNAALTAANLANTNHALNNQATLTQNALNNGLTNSAANAAIQNNIIHSAAQGITTAAAAQEAAQHPALNLWNASLGLNGATTGALAAAAGKGTTQSTNTQRTGGGGGLLSGLLGGLL